ncbi:MAG: hypothetical protein CMI36_00670 [Owenweeksia sp.]|nr:hypothetical protein [Owenweeksia sp.]MBF97476.1 hypothetical protein [Owenweeksia sp.]HBF21781.1 hypothetical protein [Cryomorphaceae bacterium]HCQ15660.1 hypothetical protein [Cryomorphaceae bacterium]|tara:strand:- start:293 stop:754 length:462 start_codon:yes stop_codon:yes gene_type:complete
MKKVLLLLTLVFTSGLISAQDQDILYTRVEVYPVLQGCENEQPIDSESCFDTGIQNMISENFVFPESARKEGVEGTIRISIVIEKDGSISETSILKGIHENYEGNPSQLAAAKELETEALNSVSGVQVVQPATMKGKPVRMKYTFPIEAKLRN